MTLEAGLRVQDYVLVERLGAGAFGEVWKATHAHLPRVVAIKFATSDAAAAALARNGVAQFGLEHAGIVKVLDANLSAAPPYVILEYVEGSNLRQVLRERGRLEIPYATAIFRQLVDAIGYAHQRGAVHGDLKPENIIVEGGTAALPPRVKVTDFQLGGASAGVMPAGAAGLRPSLETRGPLGTYHYLAPEQEMGGALDARVDIFALGVVLFEMLTGTLPQGRDLPSDLEPSISWWWDHIFARCYTGRDRRYRTVADLAADLAAAASGPRWGEMPSQRRPQGAGAGPQDAPRPAPASCPGRRAAALDAPRPRTPNAGAIAVALTALLVPFGVLASIGALDRPPFAFSATLFGPEEPPVARAPDDADFLRDLVGRWVRFRDLRERAALRERARVEQCLASLEKRALDRGYVIRERRAGGRLRVGVFRTGEAEEEEGPVFEAVCGEGACGGIR
jgi:serine/threonine-protein kinase